MVSILIVEDNPFMQTVAKKMVDKIGYESDLAATGAEALEMTNNKHYHIILLDCQIPIIDGYEVATELRNREKSGVKPKKSSIIACTANSQEGDKERCLKAGMNDYLSKPLTESALQTMIDKWIAEHGHASDDEAKPPKAQNHETSNDDSSDTSPPSGFF